MPKNIPDLSTMLKPGDRRMLDDAAGVSWVPKDPRELLLPHITDSDEKVLEKDSLEARRRKAKEVYDSYGDMISRCEALEGEIEQQCKDVKVPLNPSNNLRVIEAVRRVFGTDGAEITFSMYQECIKALGEISGQNIPRPRTEIKGQS